jgi:predicted MFS family arabinose efflux permease
VGTALASFVLVRIATYYDWHAAFFLAGIPGLILAFLIWRFIDEPPPAPITEPKPARATLLPADLLKHRNIWLCALVSVGAVGSIVVGSIFMPLYLDGPRGYDDLTWSNIMTVVGFCPAVGAIVIALASDRIGRKPPLILFAFMMAIAPAALLWFEGSATALTALMFVSWMGLGTFPLFMGVIPTETVGRAQAATAMGLVVMVGELTGGVFGPPIAGRLADTYGLDVALYIQLGLALFAGTMALFLRETNPAVLARRKGEPAVV